MTSVSADTFKICSVTLQGKYMFDKCFKIAFNFTNPFVQGAQDFLLINNQVSWKIGIKLAGYFVYTIIYLLCVALLLAKYWRT